MKQSKRCNYCSRSLRNPLSKKIGLGPECRALFPGYVKRKLNELRGQLTFKLPRSPRADRLLKTGNFNSRVRSGKPSN